MKKFKKLVTLFTASLMVVSVGALAACDGTTGGYGDPKSAEEATKVIEQLDNVKSNGVSVAGDVTYNGTKIDLDAKVNPVSGAFDASLKNNDENEKNPYVYCFMRDWKVYAAESQTEVKDFSSAILEPVADVADLISQATETSVSSVMLNLYAPTVMNLFVTAGNYMTLSLGKVANAVAFSGNTVTVDGNIMAYNMFNDFKYVIDGVNADTTVGALLGNGTVRKYAEVFTELVTYDELVTYVGLIKGTIGGSGVSSLPLALADEGGAAVPDGSDPGEGDVEYPGDVDYTQLLIASLNAIDALLKAVTPDTNSNTYDYLVKLLSSDELREMINGAAGGQVLTKNFSEYSIYDIANLASETPVTAEQINGMLTEVKTSIAAVGESVTKESINMVDGTKTIVISGLKETYTYGDEYVLLSHGIQGNISYTDAQNESANMQFSVNLTVSYSDKAFTLSTLPAKLPEF